MKPIKIPATILDIFHEAAACSNLADQYSSSSWLPSPQAIMYKMKESKLNRLGYKALVAAHAQVANGKWEVDTSTGFVTMDEPAAVAVVKKMRKPRKPSSPPPSWKSSVPVTTQPTTATAPKVSMSGQATMRPTAASPAA